LLLHVPIYRAAWAAGALHVHISQVTHILQSLGHAKLAIQPLETPGANIKVTHNNILR
jgi:hypothetical protein